jgi:hypothetical protein
MASTAQVVIAMIFSSSSIPLSELAAASLKRISCMPLCLSLFGDITTLRANN